MIRRILVANRGEIALRVFRTCRAMGIATAAVYSEADRDARFVREADIAVALGGNTPVESYLRGDAVIEAAQRVGADAIHPGYGFLAENAGFARTVTEAGLTWIGPSPRAIEVMGSKLESKRLMTEVGVPTLPAIDVTGLPARRLKSAADEIGYPLVVKASAGGGGKGMQVVGDPSDLEESVEAAARQGLSAFGDATIFLERHLDRSRHVEIQVFGDTHGNLVSLFERECSLQRRHQKIVEESPSPAITTDIRQALGEAAVTAARAVDYLGAGTVEFLFQDGEFFFLEMNTRLQVEHPVTEGITGLDLVRLQIEVADGLPLPPAALQPVATGHAIEVRLYAEDATHDFLPTTGILGHVEFPTGEVRVESGVESGSHVSAFYDPMLAKLIATAPTRDEATRVLAVALRRSRLHGVTTNRDLLIRILEHPEFLSGKFDTGFLQRHDPALLGRPLPTPDQERIAALAAAFAARRNRIAAGGVGVSIDPGFRNNRSQLEEHIFDGADGEVTVGLARNRDGSWATDIDQIIRFVSDRERVGVEHDGVLEWFAVRIEGHVHHVDGPHGYSRLVERPLFPEAVVDDDPGSLHSPMPGKIISVAVTEGETVEEGRLLVVMEAMKMEHSLRAPSAGRIASIRVAVGDQVAADQVLVVVGEEEG